MPGADADTDHILVKAKVRTKAMKGQKKEGPTRFNIELFENKKFREEYELETKNRFTILESDWCSDDKCPDQIWQDMKNIYLESAEKILGKKTKKTLKAFYK